MGRLIEADNLKRYIIETYHDPIIVCNDDEVHFVAEIIDDYPTVEAIPKAQYDELKANITMMRLDYEARLKADMVAMLTDIQSEFKEGLRCKGCCNNCVNACEDIPAGWFLDFIDAKINSLKENTDGTTNR